MPEDPKTTPLLLRRLCTQVLQRTPGPTESRAYTGAPVRMVVRHLTTSLEAMQVWLEEELYHFLLIDNFRPRTKGIEALPQRLQAGQATFHDAIAEILLSTSFSLRNPGNDTFVTVVLEQCLGLRVQERTVLPLLDAGKQMYDGRKARLLGREGASQSDFLKIVLADEGFTGHLLERHHRRLFEVAIPGEEKPRLVAEVQAQPRSMLEVLQRWLCSEAFRIAAASPRIKTDHQFIRSLYMDLLERTPDYEELRNMRNALTSMADPAPLRTVMAKVILDSGRAKIPPHEKGDEAVFVRACFSRYLGRQPGQGEEHLFLQQMRDAGAKPEHVVRALVSSPEYSLY